jgi:succinoglycan biosynthesis protein ExoV
MHITFYRDPHGNFGDDLNEMLWPRVLPAELWTMEDVVLVGVGSLLNAPHFGKVETAGKRVFVLGTGAAYGALPEGWRDWNILAVRGPLTAALLDRPETAVTDGAALLATVPEAAPAAPRRDSILFMPHHRTLVNSHWPEVARRAGIEYVDPRWSTDQVFEAYGRAKLVIAEAMHGAIVADTLRIPWIPLVMSPEISVFKWRDWLSSVELPYRPHFLPPSARLETQRFERITAKLDGAGLAYADAQGVAMSDADLLADHAKRHGGGSPKIEATKAPPLLKAVAKRVISAFDGRYIDQAAVALKAAAAAEPFLSRDAVFADRLDRLVVARDRFVASALAG